MASSRKDNDCIMVVLVGFNFSISSAFWPEAKTDGNLYFDYGGFIDILKWETTNSRVRFLRIFEPWREILLQ